MSVERFIRRVAAFEGEAVFNPYKDVCPMFDRSDAPARRRSNLRRVLDAVIEHKAQTIWIGRDLGYRGGRRTGLALTDEAHLGDAARVLGVDRLVPATKGAPMAERTATVIWNSLSRIKEPVMLWNIFPFHPYERDNSMSNRAHSSAERTAAWPIFLDLLDLLQPTKLVAIGRDAANALEPLPVPVEVVRHPSYGGQSEFTVKIEALYNLAPSAGQQSDLFTPSLDLPVA